MANLWQSPNHAYDFLLDLRESVQDEAMAFDDAVSLFERATKTTGNYEGVVTGGTKDPHKTVLDSYADRNARLKRLTDRLNEMKQLANQLFSCLTETSSRLLFFRYYHALTWNGVDKHLKQMGVEVGNLYKAHNTALDEAEKIWRENNYDDIYRKIEDGYKMA